MHQDCLRTINHVKEKNMKKLIFAGALAACLLSAQSVNAQDVITAQQENGQVVEGVDAAKQQAKDAKAIAKEAKKAEKEAKKKVKAHNDALKARDAVEKARKDLKKAEEKAEKTAKEAAKLGVPI